MRCIIFSGANIDDYKFVASFLRSGDFVICADSGLRHAVALGITADLLIGDFDSAKEIPDDKYSEIIVLPCEKDDTDTYAAAKEAVTHGATDVLIFGATGTRLDHTLGNVATLEYLHSMNITARVIDSYNEISVIKNETIRINKRSGLYLSLIPLDKQLCGVTMKGVKYPLFNASINRNETLTISNEITDEYAEISVLSGSALIIISHD